MLRPVSRFSVDRLLENVTPSFTLFRGQIVRKCYAQFYAYKENKISMVSSENGSCMRAWRLPEKKSPQNYLARAEIR